MKEKSIRFNADQVRATLEGRMTMTRMPVKPQPTPPPYITEIKPHELDNGMWGFFTEERDFRAPYSPGDRLWVRETFLVVGGIDSKNPRIVYCATNSGPDAWGSPSWKSSIHMPKWAARIWLEVTSVRVERVQEITEGDAEKEGVERLHEDDLGQSFKSFRRGFRRTWDSLYPGSWERNDWVWVIEFRRMK